jgi:hypothetical protein
VFEGHHCTAEISIRHHSENLYNQKIPPAPSTPVSCPDVVVKVVGLIAEARPIAENRSKSRKQLANETKCFLRSVIMENQEQVVTCEPVVARLSHFGRDM